MVIKGVVFDIGQTIANQPNKEGLQARNRVYYRYIYDSLLQCDFSQYIPAFSTYSKEAFVEDLNSSVVAHKKLKDERTDISIVHTVTEYRLSQHVLEVLLAQAGGQETASDLLPALDEITADKEHISKTTYELWPDTLAVMQELKRRNYTTAIASNGAHAAKHELLLETLGLLPYIDHLVISSYIGVRKPNPEMLQKICERMGLPKEEVVVVGDMLDRDILMGNEAGVKTIWIDALAYNPAQNIKRLKENNPLYRPSAGIVALSQLIPTIQLLDQGPFAQQLQVGYYLPGLKKRLDMGMQQAFVSTRRVRFIPVELLAPLEFQGPLDVLVHKATDLHLSKDPAAQEALEALATYSRKHKELLILDSVQALFTTTRRDKFEYVLDFNEEDGLVRLPRTYAPREPLHFPVLVKSAVACHTPCAHKIVSVRNEAGLAPALAEFGAEETIVQEMVHHSGLMYKIFVVGSDFSATRRESLPEPEMDYQVYDSAKLSENPPSGETPWELDDAIVQRVNRKVQMASGMSLFGYDIVVETHTGCHVIVDLNYFPSYHGFPEFPQKLEEHVIKMHARHMSSLIAHIDPGF